MDSSSAFQAMLQQQQDQDKEKQQSAMIASLFSRPQPGGNTPQSAAANVLSQLIGAYVMKNEPNWQAQSDANSVNKFAQPGGQLSQMQTQADQGLSQDTDAQLATNNSAIQSQAAQALQALPVSSIDPTTALMGSLSDLGTSGAEEGMA